jgi:hypothetical protein
MALPAVPKRAKNNMEAARRGRRTSGAPKRGSAKKKSTPRSEASIEKIAKRVGYGSLRFLFKRLVVSVDDNH